MIVEAVQRRGPATAKRLQPFVHLAKRLGVEPIHPLLSFGASDDEAGLPEDPEMLRDGRLTHPEMVHEIANRHLAIDEDIEDLPSMRFGEHSECVEHASI